MKPQNNENAGLTTVDLSRRPACMQIPLGLVQLGPLHIAPQQLLGEWPASVELRMHAYCPGTAKLGKEIPAPLGYLNCHLNSFLNCQG